ncbi:alkaline phosphatase-like protein [Aspergillus ellipticus CBS 707.79]|uniref:Alkaline phosphatase-like protein n=1 Tax=Aspergillus ellipticus CBS 707.79 TaxID=1448320 RepID=A0A319DF20_9EURO|nr:alkaline phosphatase-like protein [Aspergillus ellipticus CBS 707.79]
MRGFSLTLTGLLAATSGAAAASQLQQPLGVSATDSRPNIILTLTDDQDLLMDSINNMPELNHHLREKGTFYRNHFVTTAICCLSRASLLTGRLAHNTNITDVNPPYGEGVSKFNTLYTGKIFNAHTVDNYNTPFINGFNASDFLLDPYTYSYLNATFQRNHDVPVSYEGQYSTDVLVDKSLGFLHDAVHEASPFFLTIAPLAPHSNVQSNGPIDPQSPLKITAPPAAARHQHLFPDAQVPRTLNFNPDELNDSNIEHNDHFYRQRLRALQPNDILDNTYIVYTSDNGYHLSQHRLQAGKECGFEEDIRVPFFIRGPGVAANHTEKAVTTHIDFAPTLFEMAGLPLRSDFDGVPMPLHHVVQGPGEKARHEHVTVEFWGIAIPESGSLDAEIPPTYAVRIHSTDYDLYYSVWCSNEHQLYDLKTDPYELNNLYPDPTGLQTETTILGYPVTQVINRLDALLLVLKSYQGFDAFYYHQKKVSYSRCEYGYLVDDRSHLSGWY